ncbi:hypothetical protein GGR52DRAFT_583649 [Hypoxylon sp. FL1284]|nr:hypothetical protein GGR52DRAFT_583649 [Hypoxylon sp. FL1284]
MAVSRANLTKESSRRKIPQGDVKRGMTAKVGRTARFETKPKATRVKGVGGTDAPTSLRAPDPKPQPAVHRHARDPKPQPFNYPKEEVTERHLRKGITKIHKELDGTQAMLNNWLPRITELQLENEEIRAQLKSMQKRMGGAERPYDPEEDAESDVSSTDEETIVEREDEMSVREFQQRYGALDNAITELAVTLADLNEDAGQRAEMTERAWRSGAARKLCRWFTDYPDLAEMARASGDVDVLRALSWRYMIDQILDPYVGPDGIAAATPERCAGHHARQLADALRILVPAGIGFQLTRFIRDTVTGPAVALRRDVRDQRVGSYYFQLHHFAVAGRQEFDSRRGELHASAEAVSLQDRMGGGRTLDVARETRSDVVDRLTPVCAVAPVVRFRSWELEYYGQDPAGGDRLLFRGLIVVLWGMPQPTRDWLAARDREAPCFLRQLYLANRFYKDSRRRAKNPDWKPEAEGKGKGKEKAV